MSLHSDTLFWFRTNQYLLLFRNAACFGLIGPLLEPTIYHTLGEHSINYTTYAFRTHSISQHVYYYVIGVILLYVE
jgi:hypothetical protein